MLQNIYKEVFTEYFNSENFIEHYNKSIELLQATKRVFFIGNGGSNSICSHMYEDYAKIGGYQTFAFSDAALITCFANDFGYENAMAEWLKIYMQEGDILVAISSSGNSPNILNAVEVAGNKGAKVIALSGFKSNNKLKSVAPVSFHIGAENYGVVECFHQVILHSILDQLAENKK
jgi:D-sedoheptulose 7-phosphate isomerase